MRLRDIYLALGLLASPSLAQSPDPTNEASSPADLSGSPTASASSRTSNLATTITSAPPPGIVTTGVEGAGTITVNSEGLIGFSLAIDVDSGARRSTCELALQQHS